MNSDPYGSRGDDKRSTPHTEQHVTADTETGDDAPEVEEHISQRRENLEGAARAVDEETREQSHGEAREPSRGEARASGDNRPSEETRPSDNA